LEALYNVEQVTDTNYNYLDIDTSYYTLVPDENGLVDLQQLSDVYDLMVNDLVENLQSKNSEYTYLIIGDLSILGANRDNTINMQLLSGIGINPIICYEAFTADDDWYYGNLLGREDGQYLWQSDAGQELQKRYNNPINCFTQGGGYWVSVVQRTANWSEYPNYMFNEQSATPPIINDTDMKYYLSKGHSEIIYKYEADGGKRPTGKDLKVMEVWTNNPYPNPTVNDQYFHNYTLFYGVEIENPH